MRPPRCAAPLLAFLLAGPVLAESLDADAILAAVRAGLPREPVMLEAELTVRQPGGVALRTLLAEMRLDWGASPPGATYVLRDRFGEQIEDMRIVWKGEGEATYTLLRGNPPEAVGEPDLSQRIAGLDIAWSDLSLSFLWWKGGSVAKPERVRGRFCHVLDLPAPPGETQYGRARLWIDQEALAVFEAEIFDRDNRRVRRLVVKSIQEVDGVWMLRDLDVFSYPSRHRTALRVTGMEMGGGGERPSEGAEGEPAPVRPETVP